MFEFFFIEEWNYVGFFYLFSFLLFCTVLSSSIILSDSSRVYPQDNATTHVVEGQERNYTCLVPGIDPGASFTWTLGSQELRPVHSANLTRADGLINRTSTVTVSAVWANHGATLECRATIKEGHQGISASVIMDVKGDSSIDHIEWKVWVLLNVLFPPIF